MTVSDIETSPSNTSTPPVRLRMGQPVVAEDGPFGELADIVIDPHTKQVTHLIVEPHGNHLQARLVPLWMTSIDEDINVALDLRHLRELARVSFSELIRIGEPIDIGDEWDIGYLVIRALPYWSSIIPGAWTPEADAEFDRIPMGECEIRRASAVRSSDGHLVGHVEGMVVADEHMSHVVVTTGFPGLRRHAVLPLSVIERVTADDIYLNIPRTSFDDLPDSTGLVSPGETSVSTTPAAHRGRIGKEAPGVARRFRDAIARLWRD